jgi:broad specificity phosphatase PhoE
MNKRSAQTNTLFLVRHGETSFSGRYCGSTNPPLTRRGRTQSRSAARRLARFPIDVCYLSPLRRAEQTARIIRRQRDIPMLKSSFLREMHFGAWEGLRFQDIEKKWPHLAKRWVSDPIRVRIPGAETFGALRRRIKRFLASMRTSLSKSNILIVAHGASLSAIVLERLGRPNREFSKYVQPLGSIRRVQGRTLKWISRC